MTILKPKHFISHIIFESITIQTVISESKLQAVPPIELNRELV
jgi:hypothetical protein